MNPVNHCIHEPIKTNSFQQLLENSLNNCNPEERNKAMKKLLIYYNNAHTANFFIAKFKKGSDLGQLTIIVSTLIQLSGVVHVVKVKDVRELAKLDRLPHQIHILDQQNTIAATGRLSPETIRQLKNRIKSEELKAALTRLYYDSQNIKNEVALQFLIRMSTNGDFENVLQPALFQVIQRQADQAR